MLRSIGDNIVISSVKNTEYEKNGIIIKRENAINLIGNVVSVVVYKAIIVILRCFV